MHGCREENRALHKKCTLRYMGTMYDILLDYNTHSIYVTPAEGTWLGMAKSLRSKRKQKIKRLRKQMFYEKDKAKEQKAMETMDIDGEGRYTIV